ncbi:hypothetical protein J6590_063797 [Homalodisca vitripennis]|nr:hypothetical protein J6590_063797 [Homalodisca vitripennis]
MVFEGHNKNLGEVSTGDFRCAAGTNLMLITRVANLRVRTILVPETSAVVVQSAGPRAEDTAGVKPITPWNKRTMDANVRGEETNYQRSRLHHLYDLCRQKETSGPRRSRSDTVNRRNCRYRACAIASLAIQRRLRIPQLRNGTDKI